MAALAFPMYVMCPRYPSEFWSVVDCAHYVHAAYKKSLRVFGVHYACLLRFQGTHAECVDKSQEK